MQRVHSMHNGELAVDNRHWQRTVGSEKWTMSRGQLAVNSEQGSKQWAVKIVGIRQWALGTGQCAAGSKQWAGSGQWTLNSGRWTVDSGQ
jgi:hypothetical protein